MITSFAVVAELEARDNVSPVLLRMAEKFREIDGLITRLNEKFATLGNTLGGAGAGVGAKAEAMAGSVATAMGQIDTAVTATTANIKRMADEIGAISAAAWKANAAGGRAAVGAAAGSSGGRVSGGAAAAEGGAAGGVFVPQAWQDWQGRRPKMTYASIPINTHQEAQRALADERAVKDEILRNQGIDASRASAAAAANYVWPAQNEAAAVAAAQRAEREAVGTGRGAARGVRGRHAAPLGTHVIARGDIGGGVHGRSMLGPAGIAAVGFGYGVYESAQLENSVWRMMAAGQMQNAPEDQQQAMASQIRDTFYRAYTTMPAKAGDIEKAMEDATRLLSPLPMATRQSAMYGLLRGGGLENIMKGGTTVDQAVSSFVELAHMGNLFAPKDMENMMSKFAYLSTRVPVSVEQITRAAGYAIPVLSRSAGYDPMEMLFGITQMEQAGVLNTKSGTWIRNMLQSTLVPPAIRPGKYGREAYNHWLHGWKAEGDMPAVPGMVELGLRTAAGGIPTALMEDGKPSMFLQLEQLGTALQKLSGPVQLAAEKRIFGAQGSGSVAVLADPQTLQRMEAARKEIGHVPSPDELDKWERGHNPAYAAAIALHEFNAALMQTGAIVLPMLTRGLNWINEKVGGGGMMGMAGGALAGWAAAPLIGGALGGIFGGPAGALAGAEMGNSLLGKLVGAAIGTVGGGSLVKILQSADAIGLIGGVGGGLPVGLQTPWGKTGGVTRESLSYMQGGPLAANLSGIGAGPSPMIAGAPPAPVVNVSNNPSIITTVTLDGQAIAAAIATRIIPNVLTSIGNALGISNQHNQGPAGGSHDAPAAAGVGHN